jgi:gliding motility-associated-like protein
MKAGCAKIKLIAFILLALKCGQLHAQLCDNRYLSVIYKGISFDTFTHAIHTPSNELLAIGDLYKDHGFAAKFSAQGTPLWSYQYYHPYANDRMFYKEFRCRDVAMTTDSGFVIGGSIARADIPLTLGILLKINKYGNVLWTRKFRSVYGGDLAVSNVIVASDGDLVIYLGTDNGKDQYSFGKIIRMSSTGIAKWTTMLATDSFDASGYGLSIKRALLQTRNKNIVVGDVVYKRDRSQPLFSIMEGDLHFISLDYNTGLMKWETSYQYPPYNSTFIPDLVHGTELPDGSLSFVSSLYLPTNAQSGMKKKGVAIRTDSTGHIGAILAYSAQGSDQTGIIDVTTDHNNGHPSYLLRHDDVSSLANVDENGQILWQRSFLHENGRFPANCFSAGKKGYYMLMSNFNSWYSRLLITDSTGRIDCANTGGKIDVSPASFNYSRYSVLTGFPASYSDPFENESFDFSKTDYGLQKSIDCQETVSCCTDIADTAHIEKINICAGSSFTLPDNNLIKDSGTYAVTFKTLLGCDSIRYYHIHVNKDVSALTLGGDKCLEDRNSITLLASTGYENYYWMNSTAEATNEYSVSQPGAYWVQVHNACGSKTDSIRVFDHCDFSVYMPNAFTPNGDRLNDYFRVPESNHNRLVALKIYDRWGQIVFETRDPNKGWDGTVNGKPLSTGVFVYYLEMEGLSGNKIRQNGSFILIR